MGNDEDFHFFIVSSHRETLNEASDKIMETEKKKITPLSDEELKDVNGGVNPLKLPTGARVTVKDAADILAEQDIASRAAKERCDVLFGLNASGTPEIPE